MPASNSSKVARPALSTEGEHRTRCCTRGALEEALRRHRVSCELIKLSLFTALERSAQRSLSRFDIKAKPHSDTNLDNLLNVSGHLVLVTTQRKIVKESKNQLQ